jgi:hypothetical protein
MLTSSRARLRWRRVTAVIGVAASAFGTVLVTAPSSSATSTCNGNSSCYGLAWYGAPAGGYEPTNASGADLEVDCLSVGDEYTDFANWEVWQTTNNNLGPISYWVEAGMTAGTVVDGSLEYTGFLQFWADNRPNGGGYHEHVGPVGFTGRYFDVSFYWQHNLNWNVYVDDELAGTSTNNGFNSWGGEAGAEVTTRDSTIQGRLDNYQYQDPNSNWHGVSPNQTFIGAPGWMSGYYGPGTLTGAFAYVSTGCGAAAARMNAAWQSHAKPIAPADAPAVLRATALKIAAQNGEPNPTGLAYVAGTRHQAAALMDTSVAQDDQSYIIQMHGHFTSYRQGPASSEGPGVRPTGDTMTVVVSATTGLVTDIGITNGARPLTSVAEPTAL